jgi:hypothetical protein
VAHDRGRPAIRNRPARKLGPLVVATLGTASRILSRCDPTFTRKGKENPWRAPGAGYVKAGDLVFKILSGWVHNPQSLARFRYYINIRSAAT